MTLTVVVVVVGELGLAIKKYYSLLFKFCTKCCLLIAKAFILNKSVDVYHFFPPFGFKNQILRMTLHRHLRVRVPLVEAIPGSSLYPNNSRDRTPHIRR